MLSEFISFASEAWTMPEPERSEKQFILMLCYVFYACLTPELCVNCRLLAWTIS